MTGGSVHEQRPRTDGVRRPRRWLLHGARPFCAWLIRRRYQVVVHGAEHVPATGPVVIAANHIGVIDGPLMAIYAPRPVHALTKIEMFRGFLGRFLTAAGQIPLDRFATDPRAVRTSVHVLREGGVVGIFPEGARGAGELELFHRGAAYLALTTGATIVPLMMFGTREPGGSSSSLPRKRGTIELVFCPPYAVDAVSWPRTRDDVGEASRLLRARMLADLQESIRATGRSLPGPLPAGQHEPDPGGGVTEKSR
ncbi:1-acyl-sn-glycerol-3-phosphate acyltransferase [Nocardioides sp.]|uniref:lysophospholipid acyltransferase family protein n=1 Tax=Nocardioides sp. TaxID=35761 RepID=UPI00271FBC16|nr:lysophospholipid acyltransferase family protein [Nocardioides sp.]MDO9455121.1 lysophospholipid acyltransferase family protein [Nocardioides sp.]